MYEKCCVPKWSFYEEPHPTSFHTYFQKRAGRFWKTAMMMALASTTASIHSPVRRREGVNANKALRRNTVNLPHKRRIFDLLVPDWTPASPSPKCIMLLRRSDADSPLASIGCLCCNPWLVCEPLCANRPTDFPWVSLIRVAVSLPPSRLTHARADGCSQQGWTFRMGKKQEALEISPVHRDRWDADLSSGARAEVREVRRWKGWGGFGGWNGSPWYLYSSMGTQRYSSIAEPRAPPNFHFCLRVWGPCFGEDPADTILGNSNVGMPM